VYIIFSPFQFYGPGGRGILDLTEITWTIEPIGFNPPTNLGPLLAETTGPVVPAIVAIETDPSMPSKIPVPFLIVTIQVNNKK